MSSDRWHHASEPEGFAQWLGFHAGLTGTAVPAAAFAGTESSASRGYTRQDCLTAVNAAPPARAHSVAGYGPSEPTTAARLMSCTKAP